MTRQKRRQRMPDDNIEFVVRENEEGFVASPATNRVLGSVTVNAKTVTQSMQEFIRDVIAIRMKELNYEAIVAAQLESRIAHAISSREHMMCAAIQREIELQVAKRVADVVAAMKISADVRVANGEDAEVEA